MKTAKASPKEIAADEHFADCLIRAMAALIKYPKYKPEHNVKFEVLRSLLDTTENRKP
jgi:hypothetical protein